MDHFEVLGYCLKFDKKMVDFIDFCINGTEGDPTEPGVFEWLYSRPVTKAHFFTSAANDSLGMFGATLLQPPSEPGSVPWTDQIKGFEHFVSMDGALARVTASPSALQATMTPNAYLDDQYQKGVKAVEKVFAELKAGSGFSFTDQQFTAALRGSAKVDRGAILSEIEKKFGEPLFEKPDRAKILESLGVRP
jgi:hypothetical protein